MDDKEKAEIIKLADRISKERDNGIQAGLDATLGPSELSVSPKKNMSGADLLDTDFREVEYVVPDVICEGSSVLHGKPKTGKSEFMLGLSIRYIVNLNILGRRCKPGGVLFYGAEDSPARLKRRIMAFGKMWNLKDRDYDEIRRLFTWNTEVRRIDDNLESDLEYHLEQFPGTKLIVFDMFKNIKPNGNDKDVYRGDGAVGHFMTQFCHSYPGLAMVAIHHARKATADNPTDAAIGTGGLVGSFDTTLHLEMDEDERRLLHVAGRDVEPNEFNLESVDNKYTYRVIDEEEEYSARKRVYMAIASTDSTPTKSIVEYSGQSDKVVAHHLKNLLRHKLIKRCERGLYIRTKKSFFD